MTWTKHEIVACLYKVCVNRLKAVAIHNLALYDSNERYEMLALGIEKLLLYIPLILLQ